MAEKHFPPRVFVAECTAGCAFRRKQSGEAYRTRLIEAHELAAHDDEHLPSAVRVLVHSLLQATPAVRQRVLAYIAQETPVYARMLESPVTVPSTALLEEALAAVSESP